MEYYIIPTASQQQPRWPVNVNVKWIQKALSVSFAVCGEVKSPLKTLAGFRIGSHVKELVFKC